MDSAVNTDSEVVRRLRRMLGVPTDRPKGREVSHPSPPSSYERDLEHGDQRRGDNPHD